MLCRQDSGPFTCFCFTRGRSYKRLLEYLFFMWDPSLLDGNSEPIRVLEEGFRPAAVYEVCLSIRTTLFSKFSNVSMESADLYPVASLYSHCDC